MTHRHSRGTSLIEVLLVVAISAVLVTGAAAHFRSLRQVGDTTRARREGIQNARVALDHIGRIVRGAAAIAAISPSWAPDGSITITDPKGADHVFARVPASDKLHYGIDSPDALLATGIESLHFQGYDTQGAVSETEPERIEAVEIVLTAAVPGTSDTLTFTTRVRLRRQIITDQAGAYTTYASSYEAGKRGGLTNYAQAFGAPDDLFGSLADKGKATYSGFDPDTQTGTIHAIQAGMRIRCHGGKVKVKVHHGKATLHSKQYEDAELDPYQDTWGWLWIDVTSDRASWNHTDIEQLDIEVEGKACDIDFDSLAIRAYFGNVTTTYFWADRQGDGVYPNEWDDADDARGAPDDEYAEGEWEGEDKQSYHAAAEARSDEILSVSIAFSGYVTDYSTEDKIELRTALPIEGEPSGTKHDVKKDILEDYVGQNNKGIFFVNVSGDRSWTWSDLNNYEIRAKLKKNKKGGDGTFYIDAVGWRVIHTHRGGPAKGISGWSEQ